MGTAAPTDHTRVTGGAFWEKKNGLVKHWDFQGESFKAGPPDPDLFKIPEGCSRKFVSCSSSNVR